MYPNLSYILHDLLGTSRDNAFSIVQTFGLFLGLTFFSAAYILYRELKRKEAEGLLVSIPITVEEGGAVRWTDILSNAFFGLVLGLKLPLIINDFEAFKDDAAGVIFSTQGNWGLGLLGILIFGGLTYWQEYKKKLPIPKKVIRHISPAHRIGDITFIAVIFGILGSRLFSVLENMDAFWEDPLGQLFSGSGLTIYGGLILAFIANRSFLDMQSAAWGVSYQVMAIGVSSMN